MTNSGTEDDRRARYLQELVRHGSTLGAGPSSAARERRQHYLQALVQMGRDLGAAAHSDGIGEFKRLIVDRATHLRWRLLGAAVAGRAALSPVQRRILDTLEAAPDLLRPLGEARTELTHTRLLTWFLSRPDDVGLACRRTFFDLVRVDADPSTCQVRSERVIGRDRRVDISIEAKDRLIFVEVKVDSTDHEDQLVDYADALDALCKASNKHGLLVYLTREETDTSTSTAPRTHRSFETLLKSWLPLVLVPGGTSLYLAQYLRSVASEFYDVIGSGEFEQWGYGQQRRALSVLRSLEEPWPMK